MQMFRKIHARVINKQQKNSLVRRTMYHDDLHKRYCSMHKTQVKFIVY